MLITLYEKARGTNLRGCESLMSSLTWILIQSFGDLTEERSECRDDSHPKDRCKQKASIHSCIVSRFLSRDQKFTNCLKLPPKSCMMKKSLLVWIKSSDSHFNGNEESILLIFLLDYRIMNVWGGGVCHTNLGRPKNRLSLRLYLFNRKEVVIPK